MKTAIGKAALNLTRLIWGHPANRGRRVRAVSLFVGWQFYKRLLRRPIDVTERGGLRFKCYPDSQDAGRMIYFNRLPDPAEMTFIKRYLRPGDAFIDAGANVGIYTLFAAQLVGPSGSVIAFEPDPGAADRLRENVDRNGQTWV